MKKFFLSLLSVFMLTTMQLFADGPLPYSLRVLTFEDADAKEGFRAYAYDEDEGDYLYRRQNIYFFDQAYDEEDGDIDEQYDMNYFEDWGEDPVSYYNPWSKLITPNQIPGNSNSPMLYCDSELEGKLSYYWYDGGNTFLYSQMIGNTGMWAGHAISHYWGNDIDNQVSYTYDNQLAVYHEDEYNTEGTSGGGHDGSNNFCVHYGYLDGWTSSSPSQLPAFKFKDGVARVIDHMYVTPTIYSYCAFVADDPLGLTSPTYPDDQIYIEAYGFKNQAEILSGEPSGGPVKFYLADGASDIVTDWTKWDLSELGEVIQVGFNMGGSSFAYSYGFFVFPAYFAYDDVAVRFPRDYYERTVSEGNYGTICLPRNVAADDYEGAEFYQVVERTADWITLEEVDHLEKGKGYIFKATAETLRAYYNDGDEALTEPLAASATNVLQGSFLDNQVIPENMWFLLNNELRKSNGSTHYVDANRAYLSDFTPAPSAPAPGRRRVNLPVHNDAPASLNTVGTQDAQATKIMKNGVIYIQKNGYLYNIQGQKAQ